MKSQLIVIMTVHTGLFLFPSGLLADDSGEILIDSVIGETINAISSRNLPAWDSSQEANELWAGLVISCKTSFSRLLGRDDERWLVNRFVQRFGEHGPSADFAIMMALGRYGVPAQSAGASLISTDEKGPEFRVNDIFRHRQLLVAECQTRLFCQDSKKLERYIHFLVWAGFLDERGYSHYKRRAADHMASGAYWWHARNALVLMEFSGATTSTRLEPESIYRPFTVWLGDVSEFEIDFPKRDDLMPFDDWHGVAPISGGGFRQIFD